MNALFAPLGVISSDLVQMKGMNPEKNVITKKMEFGENSGKFLGISALRRDISGNYSQLGSDNNENDRLVDPLGVSGSDLVQKKGIHAENVLTAKIS